MEVTVSYYIPDLGWPDDWIPDPQDEPHLSEFELSEEEFLQVLFYVEPVTERAAA